VVLVDDGVTDGEPESGAFADFLGGEERVEDFGEVLGLDAQAGVVDFNDRPERLGVSADLNLAALGDGLGGIDEQVHEHLLEFLGIAFDQGQVAVVLGDVGLVLEFVPDDFERALETVVEVGHAGVAGFGVGEVAQVFDDMGDALGALDGFVDHVVEVLEELGEVDLALDPRDGLYKVLDINPRVGQAFRLFVAENDMDVVKSLYLDLTGQKQYPIIPREGRRWIIEDYDIISSLHYHWEGTLGFAEWFRSFKGVEEAAWFSWNDPLPFLMMVSQLMKRSLIWSGKKLGFVKSGPERIP